MKKNVIKYGSIVLSFLAGILLMSVMTRMGNRDMTAVMAEATLPVFYAEVDGRLCNETHGYVEEMDGRYMKDTVIGISDDHALPLRLEKYNAQIKAVSYEVRSTDQSRLIQKGALTAEADDGQYLYYTVELKDLLEKEEDYLLKLIAETEEQPAVYYYMELTYLGVHHVADCVEFAEKFHQVTVEKQTDSHYLNYLEPNGTMDGKSLGYVNIHSRSGPITWGDVQITQTTDSRMRFTDVTADVVSLVLQYQVQNADTLEHYAVEEAFRIRYTVSRMYLLAYERTAEKIFEPGRNLTEDGKLSFGIQGEGLESKHNKEENVIGFVQQGQLWCYDFGQNRLSLVYGFEDDEDARGTYDAHEFRILKMEDSGSMQFLVYGYMNRGKYEGRSGILLCRYDALLNTVEEQFFLPSDRPYEALKEEVGKLAVENNEQKAWLSYKGTILEIDLNTCSSSVLAEGIKESWIQVSESGQGAAWTDEKADRIYLLDTEAGQIQEIQAADGEAVRALGFMEEDFIYGTAWQEMIRTDQAGREIFPMYRVVIRNRDGGEVREFEYASKGKYVTDISIVENRIDLTCITMAEDGTSMAALSEPITYTSEKKAELLKWKTVYDEQKRNEMILVYGGTVKSGSMKQPKVKLVLFDGSRTLVPEMKGQDEYLAYSFDGHAAGSAELSESVQWAYEHMGSVWKNGRRFWSRGVRKTRVLLEEQKMLLPGWETFDVLEGSNILSDCTLDMVLYYVEKGMPAAAMTQDGAVLIVGYDPKNIYVKRQGQDEVKAMGRGDAAAAFEEGGSLFLIHFQEN